MALKLNGTNSVAAPAYAGDDADTGLQCGTDELKLVTGGTARATVDSSGRVGIGTTAPQTSLEVKGANTLGKGQLLVRSASAGQEARMTFIDGSDDIAEISTNGDNLYFYNERSSGAFQFYTGGSERIAIDQNGTLKLISSGGIDFSGIQTNASGMSSETLDSYEEGEFTITTNANLTSSTAYRQWRYTKIGRQVTVTGLLYVTSESGTDNVSVSLPFAAAGSFTNGASAWTGQVMHRGVDTGNNGLAWFIAGNTSEIRFYHLVDNGAWSRLINANLAANDEMYMTCTYFT